MVMDSTGGSTSAELRGRPQDHYLQPWSYEPRMWGYRSQNLWQFETSQSKQSYIYCSAVKQTECLEQTGRTRDSAGYVEDRQHISWDWQANPQCINQTSAFLLSICLFVCLFEFYFVVISHPVVGIEPRAFQTLLCFVCVCVMVYVHVVWGEGEQRSM